MWHLFTVCQSATKNETNKTNKTNETNKTNKTNKTNETTTCGIFLPKCNLQDATCKKCYAFSNIQTYSSCHNKTIEQPPLSLNHLLALKRIAELINKWMTLTECPPPLQQQTKASQYSKLAGRQISQLRVLRLQLNFNPNPKMLNYWFSFHQLQR